MKQLLHAAVAVMMFSGVVFAQEPAKKPAVKKPAPVAEPQPDLIKEEAQDPLLSFQATVDLYSAYVWRGYVINDRPVWQPAVSATLNLREAGALTAEVWGNFDMTERNRHHTGAGLNEIDYTVDYTINLYGVDVSAGHIWYTYPKVNGTDYENSEREVYTGLAYPNQYVTPSAKLYYSYSDCEGVYGELGLNKEINVTDKLVLGADATLGLGDDDYIVYQCGEHADGGWNDVTFDIYTEYAICDHFSIGAKLAWSSLLGDASRHNEPYHEEDQLWGGINLKASF